MRFESFVSLRISSFALFSIVLSSLRERALFESTARKAFFLDSNRVLEPTSTSFYGQVRARLWEKHNQSECFLLNFIRRPGMMRKRASTGSLFARAVWVRVSGHKQKSKKTKKWTGRRVIIDLSLSLVSGQFSCFQRIQKSRTSL